MTHITGVFDTNAEANAAVLRLLDTGFNKEDISLSVSDDVRNTVVVIHTTSDMFTAARLALHSSNETIEAA